MSSDFEKLPFEWTVLLKIENRAAVVTNAIYVRF